jgi:hypothetical protein
MQLVQKLKALSALEVETRELSTGQTVIVARNFTPISVLPEELSQDIHIHNFRHGNEGKLVELVKNMPQGGELWVVGNDDAAGIGALGVAAGLIAEEAQFTVHSVLFEDTSLTIEEREGWVHTIRQNPKILEDHLKVSSSGELLVRRAVQGSAKVRPMPVRSVGFVTNAHGTRSVSAIYPPPVSADEVEIAVNAVGITDLASEVPLAAFFGTAEGKRVCSFFFIAKSFYQQNSFLGTWRRSSKVGRHDGFRS